MIDGEVLLRLEERLAGGEVPADARPVLLESVRHLIECRYRPGARSSSTERRGVRKGPGRGEKKKGHGRKGAHEYTGAERVVVPHPGLKAGDSCPEKGCAGKVYDTRKPASDVEMKASAPIMATVFEREVLRCSSCQATFTAPPSKDATGTKYHASVDAVLSVMRYALGMPHNRLAQWQSWAGVPLPATTQFERAEAMANAALPIHRHLEVLAGNRAVVRSDDTEARILELLLENKSLGPGERTGIRTTGIVAGGLDQATPQVVLYATGRRHAGENVDRIFSQRDKEAAEPIHLADASSMAPRTPRVKAHCLAHARRYFIEIQSAFPEHCERVLDDFATIYRNDGAAREMDPQERLDHHQEHSGPVMAALYDWAGEQLEKHLVEPNSRLGKAFSYLRNHWDGLTRFLHVPGVPLDNNATERELRPVQRHRKNSLFFKTTHGAAVGDILLSLIRTSVANGCDPIRYLTAVAQNAPRARASPEAWLPWTYKQTMAGLN